MGKGLQVMHFYSLLNSPFSIVLFKLKYFYKSFNVYDILKEGTLL